jgi:hypothetical protein
MPRSFFAILGCLLATGCGASAPSVVAPRPSADGATIVRLTRHLSGPSQLSELEVTIDGRKVFGTNDPATIPGELFHQKLSEGAHVLAIHARTVAKCGLFANTTQVLVARASQSIVVGWMPSNVVVDLATADPWGAPEDRLKVTFAVYQGGSAIATREVAIESDECGPEVDEVGPWKADPAVPAIALSPNFFLAPGVK